MKIHQVTIKKFRSIENETFLFNDLSAIVGANNSGKSAILKALNAFFNPQDEIDSYKLGRHDFTTSSYPTIEIVFTDTTNSWLKNNADSHGHVKIQHKYSRGSKEIQYKIKKKNKNIWGKLDQNIPIKLLNEIAYVLIPADRDHSNAKVDKSSLLRELIETALKQFTKNRDAVTPQIVTLYKDFKTTQLSKISKELTTLYALDHDLELFVDYEEAANYKLLLEGLRVCIKENGKDYWLEDCGSGVQSLAIIAMYRYLAKLNYGRIIIGLEEPEMNLHPQAQIQLMRSIRDLVDESMLQVIFTTHSTVMVDQLKHEQILLCHRHINEDRGMVTKIYQLAKEFWNSHHLDESKYYQFMKYRNSEFLFASYVIVVESKNDAQVVRRLLDDDNTDVISDSVSIINLNGIRNLQYPFYLLKEFQIPFIMIVDKDFFFDYSNDNKEESRDSNGFFKYDKTFKRKNTLIRHIITKENDRSNIELLLSSNHSKAMKLLSDYGLICFKWNLEMDLVNSKGAKSEYCRILNMPMDDSTASVLLKQKGKAIKRIENLIEVIDNIENKSLPNSYKKIKSKIKQDLNNLPKI